jgi:aspartate carbamoyltransferase catalytic subunit
MPRHLLSIDDLSRQELLAITEPVFPTSTVATSLRGTLAMLFQQPSLRTMSSFAHAGTHFGLAPIAVTSTGNALRDQCDLNDEVMQLGLTSSCVVARTTFALEASLFGDMQAPLINAGDGDNEHPTQSLVDIATLRHFGLAGKLVAIVGNPRHRVNNSLFKALRNLGVHVRFVCPAALKSTRPYLESMHCVTADSEAQVDAALRDADYVYLTPVQHTSAPAPQAGGAYTFDLARASRVLRNGAMILHPFPRLGELAKDLDGSRFDAYRFQTTLGPEIRRRILALVLDTLH